METNERIVRLEESLGYAERRNEELTEHVAALSRKVEDVLRKVAVLEARLGEVMTSKFVRSSEAERSQPDDNSMNF